MRHAHEDVFYAFWFGCAAFVVAIVIYYFLFLDVSTLWFIIPQFVQYFLVFPILLCVIDGVACLVFYGTKSAFLASTVVMPSSHNIVASLRCCSVDHFILAVAILKYDYILALNIIIKKMYVVGTCKPWANF